MMTDLYFSLFNINYKATLNITQVSKPFSGRKKACIACFNTHHGSTQKIIESMMVTVLRPRQGNPFQVFALFTLMRGNASHETNNQKTSSRYPCRGLNTILDVFFTQYPFRHFHSKKWDSRFQCLHKDTKKANNFTN